MWKDCSTNVNVRAMKIWVEKLGNTLFGVNSRIRTRDGICCQGILLPRFTGRFLDKNNETISTTASFFFHYRLFWWTVCAWNFPAVQLENYALDFSEKKFTFQPGQNFNIVTTTNFYKSMLYSLFWLTVVRYRVSDCIPLFFETETSFLRSSTLLVPLQQRLQISFQRKKKSIFQDTVYSLHPTENLWQNMTLWLVYEISVLRLLLFF